MQFLQDPLARDSWQLEDGVPQSKMTNDDWDVLSKKSEKGLTQLRPNYNRKDNNINKNNSNVKNIHF